MVVETFWTRVRRAEHFKSGGDQSSRCGFAGASSDGHAMAAQDIAPRGGGGGQRSLHIGYQQARHARALAVFFLDHYCHCARFFGGIHKRVTICFFTAQRQEHLSRKIVTRVTGHPHDGLRGRLKPNSTSRLRKFIGC